MTKTIDDLSVLIIDDNQQAIRLIKMMLEDVGIPKIATAKDGNAGWEAIDGPGGNDIDVIICDWNMPGMTGIELLKKIRAAGKRVPFIMITGRDTVESTVEAATSGVSYYLPKPFGPEKLVNKILQATGIKVIKDDPKIN